MKILNKIPYGLIRDGTVRVSEETLEEDFFYAEIKVLVGGKTLVSGFFSVESGAEDMEINIWGYDPESTHYELELENWTLRIAGPDHSLWTWIPVDREQLLSSLSRSELEDLQVKIDEGLETI